MAKKNKNESQHPSFQSTDEKRGGIGLADLVDWVNEADDATIDARNTSEKCRRYYDSQQWSAEEARALKKRKQAPVVINRIKPKIDGLMGMERANRTTAKAYPRTPKHTQGAQAATEAIRFVLDDQFYRQTRSAAWDNLTVEGTGGVEVIVKDKPYGICVEVNHIMWDRIIHDPHSRRKDFSDARYLGQVVWMDYDQAAERFPDGKEMLEQMINGSQTYDDRPRWIDSKRKRVKIVELYYMEGKDWFYSCFTRGGFLKDPKVSPYKNEDGETEHPYAFGSLFVDIDGNRYGAVMQYLDVQDEINKRRSKALHLMSVRQVRGERGAVEDVNKAREELARPDGYIETTPGMEFEVLKTGDMAQAQFKLLEEAKLEVDHIGYSSAASGKEERSMSGVALKSRELAAQTELAPMFDVLKHLDVRVYRMIWNRIRQYWKAEKWIRVTDDPSTVRFVALNYTDPATGMTQNSVDELDVDIVIDDAPDSVTVQQEEFTALSEMVKSGIPIPSTAIVEASSLKNKERILQEMRQGMAVPPELQERMQMMQEEAQKLAQENQQLKADQSTEHAKIQAGMQADAAKLQAQHQAKMAELQMQREVNAEQAKLEREKAEADLALKAFVAEQDAQIAEKQLVHQTALKAKEQETTAAQGNEKLRIDEEHRKRESDIKIAAQAREDESTAMPNFMKTLEGMMKAIEGIVKTQEKMLSDNAKAMEKIATAIEKKGNQTITLGGIKRDSEGMLTSASATIN
jgi:hypothetical protein